MSEGDRTKGLLLRQNEGHGEHRERQACRETHRQEAAKAGVHVVQQDRLADEPRGGAAPTGEDQREDEQ